MARTATRQHKTAPDGASGHNDTLSERAYRELEEQIVRLRIAPGTMVTEAVLSHASPSLPRPAAPHCTAGFLHGSIAWPTSAASTSPSRPGRA